MDTIVVELLTLNHASVDHDNNKKEINMAIINSEKFKTAKERTIEFNKVCNGKCYDCKIFAAKKDQPISNCTFVWLGMEADEEKLLPCPFCGSENDVKVFSRISSGYKLYGIRCENRNCLVNAETVTFKTRDEAIATWNRRV